MENVHVAMILFVDNLPYRTSDPFYGPGVHEWCMSSTFLQASSKVVQHYFLNSSILLISKLPFIAYLWGWTGFTFLHFLHMSFIFLL